MNLKDEIQHQLDRCRGRSEIQIELAKLEFYFHKLMAVVDAAKEYLPYICLETAFKDKSHAAILGNKLSEALKALE